MQSSCLEGEAKRFEKGHVKHVSDNGDDSADVEYVIA